VQLPSPRGTSAFSSDCKRWSPAPSAQRPALTRAPVPDGLIVTLATDAPRVASTRLNALAFGDSLPPALVLRPGERFQRGKRKLEAILGLLRRQLLGPTPHGPGVGPQRNRCLCATALLHASREPRSRRAPHASWRARCRRRTHTPAGHRAIAIAARASCGWPRPDERIALEDSPVLVAGNDGSDHRVGEEGSAGVSPRAIGSRDRESRPSNRTARRRCVSRDGPTRTPADPSYPRQAGRCSRRQKCSSSSESGSRTSLLDPAGCSSLMAFQQVA
jgi:hypothetical protein